MEEAVVGGIVGGVTVLLILECWVAIHRWFERRRLRRTLRRWYDKRRKMFRGEADILDHDSPSVSAKLDGESDDIPTEPDDLEQLKRRPTSNRGFYA